MKILLDMNLSPDWVIFLQEAGHDAIHWSTVGKPDAPDHGIMVWARDNGYVLFTHDLDFGSILAATRADCPSVFQIRAQNITPQGTGHLVLNALDQFESQLDAGALVVINEKKSRARILPLNR